MARLASRVASHCTSVQSAGPARRPAARPTAAPRDSTAPGRRTATRRPRGASDSADVPLDVGQQGELARPLDRRGELALVSRAHPRQSTRENLAALGQKPPERAIVLVVEHPDPGLAHGARLRGSSHASSSSISSTTTSATITAGGGSGFAGRPSDTTTRYRTTPSSSFTARSYSGKSSAAVSNWATT